MIPMTPKIQTTRFGAITIDGKEYDHDVMIRLDGEVKKRKKKASKKIYGTSHKLSKDEAKIIYEKGADQVIIGSGQMGVLKLSSEAEKYFAHKECRVLIKRTPRAIEKWNEAQGKTIGVFHVTC